MNSKRQIWAVILAAGESKRMSRPKLTLPFGNSTIIESVVSNIPESEFAGKKMVLGGWKEEILKAVSHLRIEYSVNDEYLKGMLSSVRCGIRSLPSDSDAAVIFPGDQPGIPSEVPVALIRAWEKTGKGIVIAVHDGKRGHPILIDKKYFSEINRLNDELGLRELSVRHPGDVEEVETGNTIVLRDIDTPEDYLNATK